MKSPVITGAIRPCRGEGRSIFDVGQCSNRQLQVSFFANVTSLTFEVVLIGILRRRLCPPTGSRQISVCWVLV